MEAISARCLLESLYVSTEHGVTYPILTTLQEYRERCELEGREPYEHDLTPFLHYFNMAFWSDEESRIYTMAQVVDAMKTARMEMYQQTLFG